MSAPKYEHPPFTEAELIALEHVLSEVMDERCRQQAKWGQQNHPDGTGGEPGPSRSADSSDRLQALRREHAEASRVLCNHVFREGRGTWRHILREEVDEAIAEDDKARLRQELVQVAAVAVAWIEKLDREVRR